MYEFIIKQLLQTDNLNDFLSILFDHEEMEEDLWVEEVSKHHNQLYYNSIDDLSFCIELRKHSD